MPESDAAELAEKLLTAQVEWLVADLTSQDLSVQLALDLDRLLAAGEQLTVGELVDSSAIKAVARYLLTTVPPSSVASTVVVAASGVIHQGPPEAFSLADLIDRHHVEALVDEALALNHLIEPLLDSLTDSPLVAGIAAKFVGKIVSDVLQANRAVAEKIPGVGSLMSLSANAAGKVMGAADKPFEALLGDTAGKGAAFAMRRLNKVIAEIAKDPQLKAAILQVYDLYAEQQLPHLHEVVRPADAERVGGLLQDIVIAGAPTEPVLALTDALVDAFLEIYAEHSITGLIGELDLTREDLLKHAEALVPRILQSAHANGVLEGLIRQRLEPFFRSDAVTALLA